MKFFSGIATTDMLKVHGEASLQEEPRHKKCPPQHHQMLAPGELTVSLLGLKFLLVFEACPSSDDIHKCLSGRNVG